MVAVLGTLVFFSGVLAIFAADIDAWASRGRTYPAVEQQPGFDFDRALDVASVGVDRDTHDHISLFQQHGGPLLVYLGTTDHTHAYGVALEPETLDVLIRREGAPTDVLAPLPQGALARFMVELHVYLLLPQTLGLLVTGLVGFGLLVLLVSGFVVHQPTRAKLTRPPRTTRLRAFAGDLHTLVGSWTLPYTAVIAATGAFFCFSSTVVLPVLAAVRFDGDYEAVIEAVVAEPPVEPGAGVSPLEPIVRDALARSDGASLRLLHLDEWGTPEARAMVELTREGVWGDDVLRYVYAGHDGRLLTDAKPEVGSVPSLSSELLELIDDLHFGTLLGRATQLLWALLGLTTCALAATGLIIHARRQTDTRAARVTGSLAVAMSGGLLASAALVLTSWAMTCALGLADPGRAMTATLIMGLTVSAVLGARWSLERALAATLACAGLGLLAAPLLVALANGLPLARLWSQGPLTVLVVGDLLCVALGLASLAGARALTRRARSRATPTDSAHATL